VRIVLDTNVVVSALLWRGPPHRLLRAVRDHDEARLYSSPALIEELADVLSRPMAAQRFTVIGMAPHAMVADYLEAIELVEPRAVPLVARDRDDDHVLACAVAAGARFIVTGDGDLLDLRAYDGIRILSPKDALALLAV
jgi:uncharacterized protein